MKIGFLSDIHEDLPGLRTAVTVLEKAGCDILVCLGDIVGFSFPYQRSIGRRDANACVDLVRDQCSVAVAGNHDLYALRRIPAYPAGFPYTDDWYTRDAHERRRRAGNILWHYDECDVPQHLSSSSRAYLSSLPEFCTLTHDGVALFFSHFRYPDLSGSVVASLRSDHLHEHFRFVRSQQCRLSFSGHGHPEGFAYAADGRLAFGGFGAHRLPPGERWVVCPAVAQTPRASGVLTFDTVTQQLDVVPLTVS
ncbi:MAG: metallophosphoesterase family protein [Bacteroidetes bacterium]|nr:metallophosphoesterase family protein [Bacteroidota bacterium]